MTLIFYRTLVIKYNSLPLLFEANRGQVDKQVQYLSRGKGYGFFFTPKEAVMTFNRQDPYSGQVTNSTISMHLIGANPNPEVLGKNSLVTKTNYLIGNDPSKWKRNVSNYEKVLYKEVYPGIDLIYYGNKNTLEYDFIVFPGADSKVINMEFEGVESMELDDEGHLVLISLHGNLIQRAPMIYQEIDGKRNLVNGNYRLLGKNQVGYEVNSYDREKPLVIDPFFDFSTFFGGNGLAIRAAAYPYDIAVAESGEVYIIGTSNGLPYPSPPDVFQKELSGTNDIFVAQLNANGSTLEFFTYLGGTSIESNASLTLDSDLNIYIAGTTTSIDFPTAGNPVSATSGGLTDAFVAILSADGKDLTYSTYIGGIGHDYATDIAIDGNRDIYITGQTNGFFFPLVNSFQGTEIFGNDAFLTKLNPSEVLYSTYFGGSGEDDALAIAIDNSNRPFIVGSTQSIDLPFGTSNGFDSTMNGTTDGFVVGFLDDGSDIFYGTYLGGVEGETIIRDISLSPKTQDVYITGLTTASDFPTKNAFQTKLAHLKGDTIISKLAPNTPGEGSLLFSSFFSSGFDPGSDFHKAGGYSISVDDSNNIFIAGHGNDIPLVDPISEGTLGFVAAINIPDSGKGNILFSTPLDLYGFSQPIPLAIDSASNIYVTSNTPSEDFPVTKGAFQTSTKIAISGSTTFVSKINPELPRPPIDIKGLPLDIVSPYWQADTQTYSFISVAHPSLSGMSTQMGIVMHALLGDGDPSGIFKGRGNSDATGKVQFTINADDIKRVFIVSTNHLFFQPENVPDGVEVILVRTNSGGQFGQLQFFNTSKNLNTCVSSVENHCGFPDLNQLSLWGAVVVQDTSTGFAMSFIGDNQDSRAVNYPQVSGVN